MFRVFVLSWKYDFPFDGVQFLLIASSKTGPNMQCLYTAACFFPHFQTQQPPPHSPLYRDYFSTYPLYKSLKKISHLVTSLTFRAYRSFFYYVYTIVFFSKSTSLFGLFIFWLSYFALLFQVSVLSGIWVLNFLRLLQHYSILQSSSRIQSATSILLCTTKYYCSHFLLKSIIPILLRHIK